MWMSIEVIDGASSARQWSESHGDPLIVTALLHGARDWSWHHHPWGVVLELDFADDAAWDRFLAAPATTAALDAVPDPVWGVIMYRGRGGSSGARDPRKPRPLVSGGAAALPLPLEEDFWQERTDYYCEEGRLLALAGR